MMCSICLRSVTDKLNEFNLWYHVADRSLMCEDAEALEDEIPEGSPEEAETFGMEGIKRPKIL